MSHARTCATSQRQIKSGQDQQQPSSSLSTDPSRAHWTSWANRALPSFQSWCPTHQSSSRRCGRLPNTCGRLLPTCLLHTLVHVPVFCTAARAMSRRNTAPTFAPAPSRSLSPHRISKQRPPGVADDEGLLRDAGARRGGRSEVRFPLGAHCAAPSPLGAHCATPSPLGAHCAARRKQRGTQHSAPKAALQTHCARANAARTLGESCRAEAIPRQPESL